MFLHFRHSVCLPCLAMAAILAAMATLVLPPSIASAAAGPPVVWVLRSMERIGPADAPGANTRAQIWAARGESESFQIAVRAAGGNLTGVNVTMSDLTTASGARIAAESFTLYREHFAQVTKSSPDWGGSNRPLGPGWYPDGLIPFRDPATGRDLSGAALDAAPFAVAAGANQVVWVDLLVPRTAAPGTYTGEYTVTSDQGTASGTVELRVWNFTLPVQPSLKSSFQFGQAGSAQARAELLRHRLMPLQAPLAEEPSLVRDYGLNATHLGYWSGADYNSCTMSPAPPVSELLGKANAHDDRLALYNYTADEIGRCASLFPRMKEWARNLHAAGVKNLVTMSPVAELMDDGSGTGRSAVDIWVVLPVMYDGARSTVMQALGKGDAVWSYNCLVQDAYSPKWTVDFAPVNFRIQPGILNQAMSLDGLLYWRVDYWKGNPWTNINNTGTFSSGNYPGEGVLVYPGTDVGIQGVAPTMRLKWLRDGTDDYEYIELLKAQGRGEWALATARQAGSDWRTWTRSADFLESVRYQLGSELDRLGGGPVTNPPGQPGSPSPASGATGVALAPVLSWAPAANATAYDVYFAAGPAPAKVATVTAASYQPGALRPATAYSWRVVAKNQDGESSSGLWSFTTAAAPPAAPVLSIPANGATGVSVTPTLSWSGAGATSFDVYFGTSSAPPRVATVSAAGYQPGQLAAGAKYYWRVVAKNSGGEAASGTWSFTTASAAAPPPSASQSVSPSSGTGLRGQFEFSFTEPLGVSGLARVSAVFNNRLDSRGACYYHYYPSTDRFYLSNDFGTAWMVTRFRLGGTIRNSQCAVNLTKSALRTTSTSLTLSLDVEFTPRFGGPKWIYMQSQRTGSAATAWRVAGNWTVAEAAGQQEAGPLPFLSVTPNEGAGSRQRFEFVHHREQGLGDLRKLGILFNHEVSGAKACWIFYDLPGNTLYLADNTGTAWKAAPVGQKVTLGNARCTLQAAEAVAKVEGNVLRLSLDLSFNSKHPGTRNIYMTTVDTAGADTGYETVGTWTVP